MAHIIIKMEHKNGERNGMIIYQWADGSWQEAEY